ncbi:glycerate dehydrogenase [Nitrosomonas sp. PY1]|uniref:NAD(P)-dependent oxidoreductase n=1 Tax=Nitrosomonas sp. PY1 TaxID=1803906 RepID=UPI001FC81013|nr:NAD(P)-dependent oxidoreductase [Nitrosomonas sp. PY1]GKS68706.1 glycerate dehydrogenase [Nitrosomonas sp. PY1]
MRAVFLDFGSVSREDLDCAALNQVISPWQYYYDSSDQEIVQRICDAEIVVSNKASLARPAIEAAVRLKLICVAATGYNNVDLVAAAEHGIAVCNVRDYATPSVVQHVFLLMLSLVRRFIDYHELVSRGGWQSSQFFCPMDFPIQELSGKTLGIVGYGVLGKAVAQVAQAFGMNVLIAEHKDKTPRLGRVAFDEVIGRSDFITLHCPLSPDTQYLIGQREFALMKASAYLINTARGELINEIDLLQCLSSKRIAGAAIDVIQGEPPNQDSLILRHQPNNLIITPHIAWASQESRQRLINQLADNIRNFFQHKPFSQITDALGKSH